MYVVEKKREYAKKHLIDLCGCRTGCQKCMPKLIFVDKLADANIPEAYWFTRTADFKGSPILKQNTVGYINNMENNFKSGKCICFAGNLGTGKTYSICSILKNALMQGFDVYYTTLSDLIFYLTDNEYKKAFYNRVSQTDFLCIDEIDSRHFSDSEQSSDFFGRTFERILRYRVQNNLPTIMATNNASLDEAFSGQFKKVVNSLSKFTTVLVPSLGPDHRLVKGK